MSEKSMFKITAVIRLENLWDYWKLKPHTPAIIAELEELHSHIIELLNEF